jgi:hypothetical protein
MTPTINILPPKTLAHPHPPGIISGDRYRPMHRIQELKKWFNEGRIEDIPTELLTEDVLLAPLAPLNDKNNAPPDKLIHEVIGANLLLRIPKENWTARLALATAPLRHCALIKLAEIGQLGLLDHIEFTPDELRPHTEDILQYVDRGPMPMSIIAPIENETRAICNRYQKRTNCLRELCTAAASERILKEARANGSLKTATDAADQAAALEEQPATNLW